jgi:hypothetical protein
MADDFIGTDPEKRQSPSWMKRYTEIEEDAPSGFSAAGTGFVRENLIYNALAGLAADKPDDIDLQYNFEDHKAGLLNGLPERMHPQIAKEGSLSAATYVRDQMLEDLEAEQIVVNGGFAGLAGSFAGAIFSPENLIPWTAAAGWTNKVSRATNALRTGLIAGGTSAGAEALLATGDYSKDGEDVIYAGTFGLVLGGVIGAALKPRGMGPAPRAADEVADTAARTGDAAEAPVSPRATAEELTGMTGPPRPQTTTRDALVSTGLRAERRGGPIEVTARLEAEELLDALPNLRTISNAKKARTQANVARQVNRLDPEANVGSDVAARLDEAYAFAGVEPRGTKTISITERTAGTWDEIASDMKVASQRLRDDMDVKLARDVLRGSDDSAGAARNRSYEAQIIDTTGTEDDIYEAVNGWAKAFKIQKRLDDDWTNVTARNAPILPSDFTRLINHPSNVVKRIASDLLEGGTGTLGRENSASIYKDMYEKRILSIGLIPLNEAANEWAKAAGYNYWKRSFHTEAREKFDLLVRQEMEYRTTGARSSITDPTIIRAADALDEAMEEALTIGKRSGWEAMQDIPTRKGYVPLVWQGQAILRMGSRDATKLIARGYQDVGIPLEMAQDIAAAVVKRAKDGTAGVDANIAGLLGKNQRGQLVGALEDMGITKEKINGMMRLLDEKEATAGPSFTKGRTSINLNASLNGRSLLDLVDNDLNSVISKYARDVAGRSAMAKKGFTNDTIWNNWKSAAMKDNARVKPLIDGKVDNLSEHLDDIKSYFTANPIAGGINKNARRIQQATTVSLLGMVGGAQLIELGTVIGRLGLKAAAKAIPAADEIFTLASKKKLAGGPIDELRPLIGDFDYDHLMYRPDIVIDDKIAAGMDMQTWGKVLDKSLGKLGTMLGYASGMNTIRHMEHRMAAKMMINTFGDLAKNPGKRAKSAARMEDIGMAPNQLDDAIKQINKHAVFDANGTMTELGLTKWPEDTAEQFAIAINRHTAQVVQRQLAGETSNWMHKTVGSLLTQFRTFPIVAFEKQLLRNMKYHDQATMSTLLYGFAVSYGVQSLKAGLLGNNELEQQDIMKQTVNYMGMMSVLPEIGTLANQLGIAPDVLNTRKMGHTGNYASEFSVLDFIPAAGQVNNIAKAVSLPFKAMSGDVTDSDIRGAFLAVPLSTTVFGKGIMQLMLED